MNISAENTNIAIIGGGNIGTQFACVLSSKGYRVNVLSSRPGEYDRVLEAVDENGVITTGEINLVTDDMGEVLEGCDMAFVTHPAFRLKMIADRMLPFVKKEMIIGVIPGTGGSEFAFQECIKKGAVLFGLQRVPSVARLVRYGKRVRCEGLRNELFLASIPGDRGEEISEFMSRLWGIPCRVLPNYLSVTLTPSNPIIHTTRLRTMFEDYEDGKVYSRNPFFYGEWDDDSSELLLACDGELQKMLEALDRMDLSFVRSLKTHYESDTVEMMTAKIRSIKSMNKLSSPMTEVEGGWVPDFGSRYFTADFPYGLAIIEEFAEIIGVDVPNIKETMEWYRRATGDVNRLNIRVYGIREIEDIYSFYTR